MKEYSISAQDHINHISEKLKFLNLTVPPLIKEEDASLGCDQIIGDIIDDLQELYDQLEKAPTIWYDKEAHHVN